MSNAKKFLNYFLTHRRVTEELISKIDEKDYNYKPTPTSMSTEELVKHMLFSFHRFALVAKQGNPAAFREKLEEPETNLQTLATKYTEEDIALIESLTDDDLEKELDLTQIFGMKVSVRNFLHAGLDHEIHHKGNLFVYIREMGHTELPFYIKRG